MDNYVKNLENETINNNPQVLEYLEDISQPIAERAFMNTSFSPEKRGACVRMEYAENLLLDRAHVLDEINKTSQRGASLEPSYSIMVDGWFQSHREKLRDLYTAWLHSHARTASSFITGPANFPVTRNEKLSRYAHAKLLAMDEFRKGSIKKALKLVLPHGDGHSIQIDDPDAYDKIEKKIAALEKQREDMKAINKAIRKHFKNWEIEAPLEQEKFKGLLRTEYNVDEAQIIDAIRPNGNIGPVKTWQLQNLGANIKRYKKRLIEAKRTSSLSIDDEFSNGIKVSISDDQKICIYFGFKPSEEIRGLLKTNAFKFSRGRDNAWVRKFTLNAAANYIRYVRPTIEALEAL